ncbi:phosphotransferase enzyme family protein [Yinghuangia soli]|uniref:Phosphotransferase n=1 Tax=Yinghuangia soli TaxID=2908204 RepID=A0AA41PWG5_9ACTN|nr:phosphotransferase [Yinghuangia soli]MCF2526446.1 phosphotransferase [Yinghuangia soli]
MHSPRAGGSPLSALLANYKVGKPTGFRPVAEGLLNRGYEVATTDGRWFLKHYLDQSPQAIVFQHRVTARLSGAGIPALPPLPDRDGGTARRVGGRWFALFPWVDGAHRTGGDLDPAECAELGTLLAGVHTTLMRMLPPVQQPLFAPAADAGYSMRVAGRLLHGIRDRTVREPFDDLVEHRLIERLRMLRRHAHRRPADHHRPCTGYVHGDFHPLNLLYAERDPVAIIDWDRLAALPDTEETVRAALLFFTAPVTGTLDLARVRAFMHAYRADSDPGSAELAAAVHRLWWERLNDFWMLNRHYDERDHRTAPLFPASAALIVWWTRHYEEVLAAFVE